VPGNDTRMASDREQGLPCDGGKVARKTMYPVALLVTAALLTGAFFLGRTSSSPNAGAASTTTTPPSTSVNFSAFYLDIGASESLGFQPTGIKGHNGERTNTGYANDLVVREGLKGVALYLQQTGCPGETVQSILDTTKADACYHPPQTQLTKDIAYLKSQTGPGLVTVDLGFNDIRTCLEANPIDQSCFNAGLAAIKVDLPKILAQLKAAAASDVVFVGIEYPDPYLGFYFDGAGGPARATATLTGIDEVDTTLGQIYAKAGMSVANVPSAFQINNNTPTAVGNVGSEPFNVENACQLSWFCFSSPFGPDDHPNDAGYSLIASAIEAALPKSW
jgi:lysophospholipase L1-like esterase